MHQAIGEQPEFPKHGIVGGVHQLLPWTSRIFAVPWVTSRLSKLLIFTSTFHTRRKFATLDSHLSNSFIKCAKVMEERICKIAYITQLIFMSLLDRMCEYHRLSREPML